MKNYKIIYFIIYFFIIQCNNFNEKSNLFEFEKVLNSENTSQVGSNYIEGISPNIFEKNLIVNGFYLNDNASFEKNNLSKKEYLKELSKTKYFVTITSDEKIKTLEFRVIAEDSSLTRANKFFSKAISIPFSQIDTSRIKNWCHQNIKLVNISFSRGTILANIHYVLEKLSEKEFRLKIKKYSS